jgi:hypothetical protein
MQKLTSVVSATVAAAVVAALGLAAVNARSTAEAALRVIPAAVAEGVAAPVGPAGEYSPPLRPPPETNLYWGDTHLHTRLSADAFSVGNEAVTPEDAFRFARGETVVATIGVRARLRRPLDFLAVSDHAEYMGIYVRLKQGGDPRLEQWELGREWAALLRNRDPREAGLPIGHRHDDSGKVLGKGFADAIQSQDPKFRVPAGVQESIWAETARTADRFNEPGRFTALVAYEWTSMIGGDNLHRVVLYRDGADKAAQVLPFTSQDSTDPEDLWRALADYEQKTGGQILAIAHNGNVSNGRMFAPQTLAGKDLDADYAGRRIRWEPVYEITQVKGDGEAHPTLSPTDEFADFETWDTGNITLTAPKQPWMLQYEYARSGLREGLKHEAKLGVNPFKFGIIGSTDDHTGLSTATEDNFFGKFPESEPQPGRISNKMAGLLQESWELGASGLAAVWATENTREAIFDAFKRKEVYGTTGSRIKLRFFGGWNFQAADVRSPDYARIGYARGVPMGGDLLRDAPGRAPTFMVVSARDPDEANLDRIQIVKGWLDAKGETHEKIYDVALSDGRKVDPKTGKAPPVGSTVDVASATYSNSIGDPELATVWTDPDFDPARRAFYYVRVLEIPKPRWTTYDAKYFGLKLPANVPTTVQDRAYSSPIWYHP